MYVVPFLKYPANPPSVGDPDTIGKRTALYFLMMLLSVLLAVAAAIARQAARPSLGTWYATVAAVAAFAVVVGLAYAFLPVGQRGAGGLPRHPAVAVPARPLWPSRSTLWAGFGLVFGELAERLLSAGTRRTATAGAAGAAGDGSTRVSS